MAKTKKGDFSVHFLNQTNGSICEVDLSKWLFNATNFCWTSILQVKFRLFLARQYYERRIHCFPVPHRELIKALAGSIFEPLWDGSYQIAWNRRSWKNTFISVVSDVLKYSKAKTMKIQISASCSTCHLGWHVRSEPKDDPESGTE